MKIVVYNDKHKFKLRLPLSIIKIKKINLVLDGEEINVVKEVYRVLKDYKKKYGNFDLVDIESADGEKVKITI